MIKEVRYKTYPADENKEEAYLFLADILDKQILHARFDLAMGNVEALADMIQHYPGMEKETEAMRQIYEGVCTLRLIPEIADKIIEKKRQAEEALSEGTGS